MAWYIYWIVCLFASVLAENGMKSCVTNSTSPSCPPNSSCSSVNVSVNPPNATTPSVAATAEMCKCSANFTFNGNYSSNQDYCMVATIATTTLSTTSPTTTTTSSTTITTSAVPALKTPVPTPAPINQAATTKLPPEVTVVHQPPSEHGFASGVVLPLLVVFAFVGAIFAIRKYDLVERAQDFMRDRSTRRNRNNYVNDFDEFDDPLLI